MSSSFDFSRFLYYPPRDTMLKRFLSLIIHRDVRADIIGLRPIIISCSRLRYGFFSQRLSLRYRRSSSCWYLTAQIHVRAIPDDKRCILGKEVSLRCLSGIPHGRTIELLLVTILYLPLRYTFLNETYLTGPKNPSRWYLIASTHLKSIRAPRTHTYNTAHLSGAGYRSR
jgi:hypothetical protein